LTGAERCRRIQAFNTKGVNMQRNFYIEPSYLVGEDLQAITVAESGDFPSNVVIYTKDPRDKEYFGDFRVDMPVEFMRMLAKAINKVCDEIEENKE
jgi:hypothetical protein